MAHRTTMMIDDRKLAKVQRVLGTTGIRDTVDRAFDEILAIEARKRFVEQLRTMDGLDLDKPSVMKRAWR